MLYIRQYVYACICIINRNENISLIYISNNIVLILKFDYLLLARCARIYSEIIPRTRYPFTKPHIFPSLYFLETSLHDHVADSYCESGRNNFDADLTHRGSPREPVENGESASSERRRWSDTFPKEAILHGYSLAKRYRDFEKCKVARRRLSSVKIHVIRMCIAAAVLRLISRTNERPGASVPQGDASW